jgi:PIN domain nuclease of toxin-antitoxin system
MNLLLDSHAFIWWRDDPQKLSSTVYSSISDSANRAYISMVTLWELQIKIVLKKLTLSSSSLERMIEEERKNNGFQILPLELSHISYLENLASHHKDPFDRMLLSQGIVEDMTLVSADKHFAKYPVSLLW